MEAGKPVALFPTDITAQPFKSQSPCRATAASSSTTSSRMKDRRHRSPSSSTGNHKHKHRPASPGVQDAHGFITRPRTYPVNTRTVMQVNP